MLQDIEPFELNNEFCLQNAKGPDERSLLIVREQNSLWCRVRDGILEVPSAAGIKEKLRYLIAVDGVRFYMPAADGTPTDGTPTDGDASGVCGNGREALCSELKALGFELLSARNLRYVSPAWLRFGTLTAWQAAGWYLNNRYCGRCGKPMQEGDKERSLVCPECGSILYPKLCPVVIAAVTDGEKILLTKYAGRDRFARFALVAGFAEIGETIEQTVAREVMEETGLKVKNLRYYKSQPWAYSESLLFGFFCDVDGSREITVDPNELSTAVWTDRKDIPDYGDEISLTYEMMRAFREGKEES